MSAIVDMEVRSRRQTISESEPVSRTANRAITGARRRAESSRQLHNNSDLQSDVQSNCDECPLINDSTHERCNINYVPHITHESNVSFTPLIRDKMRRKIRYAFMNPVEKWKAKGKLPWKMFVQIVKIVIITLQISMYGIQMSRHITHQGNVITTFRELFLQNWDAVREVMAYPPTAGPYAIYTRDDFYTYIDLTVKALSNISTQAIGTFGYSTNSSKKVSPIKFCRQHFAEGSADASTFTFNYDRQIVHNCTTIDVHFPAGDSQWNNFSSKEYFEKNRIKIMFERLLVASVRFTIRLIYINSLESKQTPQCYESRVVLKFDNTLHDGQMLVSLDAENTQHACNGNIDSNDTLKRYVTLILNVISIILCASSLTLCAISLYKGFRLRKEVTEFFSKYFGHELSWSERNEFIDFWIITIIINDVLIIIGSLLETQVEYRQNESYHYNISALFLGVGVLLVWVGILRYFSFFQKYNILILTLKRAIPDVLSLFISLIMDSYETIKEYYEHGFPLTELQKFIAECPDDPMEQIYRMESEANTCSWSWRNCLNFW
ncbi:mucolipin-3-like protein [Leptotrombidium deliense]|uniref:Mucolipin-3-like protein n=1 Tax=Leptotrombidium deliense TaxID=299467 RepID=A0A443SWP7_9ACAR|nr:mucolipin-3-like protein [Leptotrombidium deliense]